MVEDDQRCLIKRCQMVGDYMVYSHDLYATYMPVMGFTLGSTFATKMASKKEDGDAEALRQCEVYFEKHTIFKLFLKTVSCSSVSRSLITHTGF